MTGCYHPNRNKIGENLWQCADCREFVDEPPPGTTSDDAAPDVLDVCYVVRGSRTGRLRSGKRPHVIFLECIDPRPESLGRVLIAIAAPDPRNMISGLRMTCDRLEEILDEEKLLYGEDAGEEASR